MLMALLAAGVALGRTEVVSGFVSDLFEMVVKNWEEFQDRAIPH